MSNIKQVHYDIIPLKLIGADINLIYGEKSNGKSYQVKRNIAIADYLEKCVNEYCNEGFRFIILRRWREDVTNLWVEKYFSDMDVKTITKGKYNIITVYKKEIYFSIADETRKS